MSRENVESAEELVRSVRFTGHGADSGIAMEMELAHVVALGGGRTRRIKEYFDRAEALEAAGLPE
jgi:ketosteroid isomerase-like protein